MNMLSAQARERLSDTSTPEINISEDGVSGEGGSGNAVARDGVYGNAASGKSISRDGGSGDGVSDDDVSKKGIYGNEASDDFSRDDFSAGISGTVSTGPDRPSQEADDLADGLTNDLAGNLTDNLADDLADNLADDLADDLTDDLADNQMNVLTDDLTDDLLQERSETFKEEQAHLSLTVEKLKKMERELEEKIDSIAAQAAAEKREIRENLALNFDGDTESMETYIEFEVMNHTIDRYNITRDAAQEKLTRVKHLLKAPYFAKVQLRYEPDEEPEEYYIGSAGISENVVEPLVIDWRSPVAETYYNQDNGQTFYTVDGHRIDVELLLRRQFVLSGDRLQSFFDTQIAIEDPLLIRSLTRQRSDKMQAITATIQKEQNAVVRHENVPVLLVNGIAGSGKTSVLLQRIAWLFYRQRDTLRPDEVVLMTLNPIFRSYIDQVLPDMGEMNPVSLTWTEFLSMAGVSKGFLSGQGGEGGTGKTLPQTLRQIEETLPALRLEPGDLRPIHQKNIQILSPERIAALLASHENIPTGERLVQIVLDELKEQAKAEIRRKERDDAKNDPAGNLLADKEDGSDSFSVTGNVAGKAGSGDFLNDGSPAEENRIQSQYGGAFHAINTCQWLDIGKIGKRLLGKKRLSAVEWLYLKMLLTGQKDLHTKYVMVDEVQDYTAAQLMVLKKYFPRARFMLLGDEFQAIREGTATFAEIHDLFEDAPVPGPGPAGGAGKPGRVSELQLTTSYRSSPEITALFAGLLPKEKQILVSSVQPSGTEPVFRIGKTQEEHAGNLLRAIQKAEKEEGLTAVLCAGARSLEKTAAMLSQDCQIPVIRSGDSLPEKGVFLITLAHAKGLEFDGVILPDADADIYPDTALARHRLYTAMSRATRRLTVLAKGGLTPLLQK